MSAHCSEIRALRRGAFDDPDITLTWTVRERDVRMTIPKVALDEYDEIPDSPEIPVHYDPEEHTLVFDLPDPEEVDN